MTNHESGIGNRESSNVEGPIGAFINRALRTHSPFSLCGFRLSAEGTLSHRCAEEDFELFVSVTNVASVQRRDDGLAEVSWGPAGHAIKAIRSGGELDGPQRTRNVIACSRRRRRKHASRMDKQIAMVVAFFPLLARVPCCLPHSLRCQIQSR